jgi:membrane protease YdiL (CAAX protease family)
MAILPLWMTWRRGALRRPRVRLALKELAIAVPLVICLVAAQTAIVAVLMRLFNTTAELGTPVAPLRDAPNEPRLYLFLIPMFTLGPVAEELFFRGFLYNALRRWMAPLLAVVIQGFVFTLTHYAWPYVKAGDLAAVFFMGVILVGVYEWRKTIWAPIALHSLQNFLFAGPVMVLMVLNSHTAAKTWPEAEQPPTWLTAARWLPIEKQANGEAQRLHAINMWGTKGLHLWKQEIRAMEAVCAWYPDDRRACAQAREGIAMIFQVYLRDPRRAIVQCNWVLSEFPDQSESCADAILTEAEAYQDIGDWERSREAYGQIIQSYGAIEWARSAAEQGLRELDGR